MKKAFASIAVIILVGFMFNGVLQMLNSTMNNIQTNSDHMVQSTLLSY